MILRAACQPQAGLTIHTLPGRAEISRMVGQFLSAIKNKRDAVATGQDLYRRVLEPLVDAQTSSLIIARRSASPGAVRCTCGKEWGNLESPNHGCERPFGASSTSR